MTCFKNPVTIVEPLPYYYAFVSFFLISVEIWKTMWKRFVLAKADEKSIQLMLTFLILFNWKCMYNGSKLTLIKLSTKFTIWRVCRRLLNCVWTAGNCKMTVYAAGTWIFDGLEIIGHIINCQSGNKWQQNALNCLPSNWTCLFCS